MLEEREVFFQHESWMQAALPRRTHRIAVEGNHEDRVFKFLLRASQGEGRKLWTELGMARPTWDEFLQLDKFGYDVRCAEGVRLPRVLYGDLAVWHGERANKYAVAHNVMRMGNNACNHTHRARAWAARVGGKNMYGYELGYAADARLATDYIADEEDWQQAFGVVWFDDVTGYFDVDVVMVHEIRGTARRQFNYMSDRWEWTP